MNIYKENYNVVFIAARSYLFYSSNLSLLLVSYLTSMISMLVLSNELLFKLIHLVPALFTCF